MPHALRTQNPRTPEPGFYLHPRPALSAFDQSVDDFHVRNGIFQWSRNIGVIQNRSGKQVPLNRVLITDGKADFLGLILSLAPHSAGLIRRRIERDFNFDTTLGAENVYSLVRNQLSRAGKC